MSDSDYCGLFYKYLSENNIINKLCVNSQLHSNIGTNVDISTQNLLDSLMKTHGVHYGTRVVCSFCDGVQNVPSLDFAAFLPISRYNAAKNADEYKRLLRVQLDKFEWNGLVITMVIDSKKHSIDYLSELPADDYYKCLYSWSTKCCAEFLLSDDDYPFRSVITPSLRQIVAYSFGRESDGVVSAEDSVVGDVCVRLADCILHRKPIDGEITKSLKAQLQQKDCFLHNYARLCSVFSAVKRYNGSFGVYI